MSGKPAARLGDIGSGHGCFPPSAAVSGSGDVIINNKPAVRQSDAYAAHSCSRCSPHGRALAAGSSTVFFNNLQAGRVGDPIDCGGSDASGSPNVFIGAASPPGSRKPFEEECPYAKDAS